ncbi:hypothetical protein [Undibacterium sp. Di24W]|uniref:hypothetical protein n=1 Tax=Undibacterium sp. Di24W TaxID=3413033 RepID=UPI003BF3D480
MQISRFDRHTGRYLVFILILVIHIGMIIISQNKLLPPSTATNTDKVLRLYDLPRPNIEANKQKTIQEINTRLAKHATNKRNNRPPESITVISQTPEPSLQSDVHVPSTTIQKNIHDLSLTLKEDLLKQEKNFRSDSKSSADNMKNLSNALADAARIQREGVIIEKKFAYDGRPVSKIKTPYGTYCVRHPKAGEKLELSPPPLPVTCGQL